MNDAYQEFLISKAKQDSPSGFDADQAWIPEGLFPFQEAIVKWAIRRGRAAVFADTGLGKTFIQAAWAWAVHQFTGNRVLILAPLCVSQQTVIEADRLGVPIQYVRDFSADGSTGLYITNYEMLDKFKPWIERGYFDGIVLDESSIVKHQDSKTRNRIIETSRNIPFRLSCTATPSPNDYMELGNQAEFLGIMTMAEMLATFFTHDSGETSKWRLKGHARNRFWEWMASWAVCIKKPSDLGFGDEGYDLPGLEIREELVVTGSPVAQTLSERNDARRSNIDARVSRCASIVNATIDQFIVWCHLNEESHKLTEAIPGSVEVDGSLSISEKEERILAFTRGDARVLITKPKIAGFGMNWQHCHKMAFVGLNDSYEQLYQAIRRCYRFGQKSKVEVSLVSADSEGSVLENIRRKEIQAKEMSDQMIEHMRDFSQREVTRLARDKVEYERRHESGDGWDLHLGDCVDVAREIPDNSVDYSIFSPPFSSLYTYSNSDRDMGNCHNDTEFFKHFGFLIGEIMRITKPGRLVSFHCMNLPRSKQNHGYIGIHDFRGELIRMFVNSGFIYHSEVCVWKDPVVAMQRTKALGLLWKQIKKDSAMSRQGIPDYVVTMRKSGVNPDPVSHSPEEFPVDLWQELASPCWMDIRQSNTLNRKMAREENDERHICPLQLDLIERCIFLWSRPGDLIFSPFAGIGSEGYVARTMGRQFIGSELKRSYFDIAVQNIRSVSARDYQLPAFQEKIGDWRPGVPVRNVQQSEESDPCQIDWIRDMNLSQVEVAP